MDVGQGDCEETRTSTQDYAVESSEARSNLRAPHDLNMELSSVIYERLIQASDPDDGPHIHQANEPVIDVETSLILYARNISPTLPHLLVEDLSADTLCIRAPSSRGNCQGISCLQDQYRNSVFTSFRHQLFSCANGIHPVSNRLLRGFQDRNVPFEISRMNPQAKANVNHYQLRNRLVVTSRFHAYYSNKSQVLHVDPSSPVGSFHPPIVVIDLTSLSGNGSTGSHISTVSTVSDDLLIAGTFGGQFAYINLNGERILSEPIATGLISQDRIINFIDSTPYSPNGPTAVISCNDHERTLAFVDCTRNEVYQTFNFQKSIKHLHCPERAIVNCTATSSDGRIRILVGDFPSTLVTDARSGKVIHEIENSHDETGTFACAWAPSGPTFATAGEDKCVRIWDARMWSATAELAAFTAPVRNLKFSPLGQGPPTLFAGEAMDYVHVLDISGNDDMFWTRQRTRSSLCERERAARCEWSPDGQMPGRLQLLHHFGDNAGMAVSPDGGEVMVANGDARYGGLIVWERTSWARPSHARMVRKPRYMLPQHEVVGADGRWKRRKI